MNEKSLCSKCKKCSERVVETHMDWHYKRDGQGYIYEYACLAGHKLWAHQIVVKCTAYVE